MQRALDMWNGMIWDTKGALVPERTFWYAIHFSWQEAPSEYTPQEDLSVNLEMINLSRQVNTAERLEPTKAQRTLGISQYPAETMEREIAYLTNVATAWRDEVQTRKL